MAKTLNVNGTQMANVTANGVAMDRVYMNGVLVFEKNQINSIDLGSSGTAQGACNAYANNNRSTMYILGSDFNNATALYSDSSGNTVQTTGFFSNGSIVRFWDQNSETFTSNDTCV